MAKLPLLNFLTYTVGGVSFTPSPDYTPEAEQRAQVSVAFAVNRNEVAPQLFQIALQCKVFRGADDHSAYDVQFSITAEFESMLDIRTAGKIPATIAANALHLTYSTARGVIGEMTAGAVNGKFILPALTFTDLIERAMNDPRSGVQRDDVVSVEPMAHSQPSPAK